MTFFRSLAVVLLVAGALGACKGDSTGDLHGFDAGDATVHFDATPGDAHFDGEGGSDLGDVDFSCGAAGCVTVTSCRAVGGVTTLDTDARAMPSSVSVASGASGHLVAFHGLRLDGTNVVTRGFAHDGTPSAEHVLTSTILSAHDGAVALGGTSGVVIYLTNDPGPGVAVVAQAIGLDGTAVGASHVLEPGGTVVHASTQAAVLGSGFVSAWLTTDLSDGGMGSTYAVVRAVGNDGTPSASPTMVTGATGPIAAIALATGDGMPALLTVEQDSGGTHTIQVRPLAADGTPGAPIHVIDGRSIAGGVTGVRLDSGTLVAWGETIAGVRREVHLLFVPDTGAPAGEVIATNGMETGTDPHLAIVMGGVVLVYRGFDGTNRGVRAVGVGSFGALAAAATTVLDANDDPAHLALGAIDATGALVALADDPASGGSQVRAVAVDCGGM